MNSGLVYEGIFFMLIELQQGEEELVKKINILFLYIFLETVIFVANIVYSHTYTDIFVAFCK